MMSSHQICVLASACHWKHLISASNVVGPMAKIAHLLHGHPSVARDSLEEAGRAPHDVQSEQLNRGCRQCGEGVPTGGTRLGRKRPPRKLISGLKKSVKI
jgi:hypothetical protein